MKATLFARPNLKVFLLGALLIMLIQHLINDGLSQGSSLELPVVSLAREAVDPGVESIVSQAGLVPASCIYAQLSDFYEERGEYRKALRYLRRATITAASEAEME